MMKQSHENKMLNIEYLTKITESLSNILHELERDFYQKIDEISDEKVKAEMTNLFDSIKSGKINSNQAKEILKKWL